MCLLATKFSDICDELLYSPFITHHSSSSSLRAIVITFRCWFIIVSYQYYSFSSLITIISVIIGHSSVTAKTHHCHSSLSLTIANYHSLIIIHQRYSFPSFIAVITLTHQYHSFPSVIAVTHPHHSSPLLVLIIHHHPSSCSLFTIIPHIAHSHHTSQSLTAIIH